MRGFIVYPTYRVVDGKAYVHLYGRLENGETFLTINHVRPYFFIREADLEEAKDVAEKPFDHTKEYLLSMESEDVVRVELWNPRDVPELRDAFHDNDIPTFEADVRFTYRFLIDNGIKGSMEIDGDYDTGDDYARVDRVYHDPNLEPVEWTPDLDVASIDIETDNDADELWAISIYTDDDAVCLVKQDGSYDRAESFEDEATLLRRFRERIIDLDPDIITGWNVIDFDLDVLEAKFREHDIPFDLGRTDDEVSLRRYEAYMRDSSADCPGRQVLDGMHLLRSSFIRLDNEKLDTAAKEFLDEGKDIEGFDKYEQLRDAYHNDTQTLIDYNIKDAQLAYDIIYEAGVLQLTIQRSLIAGMELDRVKASVASLDNLYLRALRERGYVAPTNHYKSRERRITGGHVMKSVPGLFDYVIVCDFASLYPSIMRTFNIDPLSYVSPDEACDDCIEAPNGARYRREKGIIPDLLEQLWNKRDQAREEGNELQSNAIKVLMNSVFGVLANPNCRFYNFEMANSITTFGQHLLKVTAEQIEDEGYDVIYGDTDSIFVDLDVTSYDTASEIGHRIESYVNSFFDSYVEDEFGVESYIKLEFEKTYRKFFMPKIRGKESGAKKRYAGEIVYEDGTMEMDYVGLEIVRRDWTDLAKEFQAGLIRKVFDDEDYRSFVKEYVDDLKAGELDDKLTYRKGLTKAPEDYVKTTPPHVKAAMKMDEVDTSVIEYIQTVDGPEPVEGVEHSIDYEHYIEKQLKPIANQVLLFFDTRFDDVLKGTHQASLDGF